MELYTFTARSLADALRLVREELGPDASLLHTRSVGSPLARFFGGQTIEVTAAAEPCAPSRLSDLPLPSISPAAMSGAELQNMRRALRDSAIRQSEHGLPLGDRSATRMDS